MKAAGGEQRQVWNTPQLTLVDTGLETVQAGAGFGNDGAPISSTTSGSVTPP